MARGIHRLRVPGEVVRLLRGLHPEIRRKIRDGLDLVTHDPRAGKPLREELAGLLSLRVGRFRIVYRAAGRRIIEIVAVGPRSAIYQKTLELVR